MRRVAASVSLSLGFATTPCSPCTSLLQGRERVGLARSQSCKTLESKKNEKMTGVTPKTLQLQGDATRCAARDLPDDGCDATANGSSHKRVHCDFCCKLAEAKKIK